jgi:iron complex transport system ATP-binding protein
MSPLVRFVFFDHNVPYCMDVNADANSRDLAIDLRKVGVLRSNRWILNEISWQVRANSCAAILGPNGSGKSTLARILAAHLWPTCGEVTILNQRFGDCDIPTLRNAVRMVQPAGPYDVDPSLTTLEVVLTGFFSSLALYQIPTKAMESEARRLLKQVGLFERSNQIYETLSSGERVRSLIARALVHRPKLLILDEPTAGLDLLAREQVLATIQTLFETDPHPPTTILITHHIEELPPATSNVLLLSEGKAAAVGGPGEVLKPEILSKLYNCPVQVRQSAGRFYLEVHPDAWRELL